MCCRIEKIRKLISIGDILISVNERLVIDEPFKAVAALLELLMYVLTILMVNAVLKSSSLGKEVFHGN